MNKYNTPPSYIEFDCSFPFSHLTHQSVHRRHPNDEGKKVVDDRVEAAVAEESPRKVRHALELVVNV